MASAFRAVRLLGIGANAISGVVMDNAGRMNSGELERALQKAADAPTIVSLQAGDLNTGVFDPFAESCRIAHAHGA
jgi:glutamate/tyrosine decarboxylase-like PLP-dependent enzyme